MTFWCIICNIWYAYVWLILTIQEYQGEDKEELKVFQQCVVLYDGRFSQADIRNPHMQYDLLVA